jgi:hypothetical protein
MVAVKQTRVRGWIHVPGDLPAGVADGGQIEPMGGAPGAEPRDLYGTPRSPPARPEVAPMQGFTFFGPATFHGDAVAGDKFVNGSEPDES